MTSALSLTAARHGVSRLCHFTPSLNLPHIVRDGYLRPTGELAADVRACYEATDLDRLDGHPDHICSSIEYPNAYYLHHARQRGRLQHFPDWTVLFISLEVLDRPNVLFSPRNAAAGGGRYLRGGTDGLRACFADQVSGAGGSVYVRKARHLQSCPTDLQAEVLVPGPIGLDSITGLAFRTREQAHAEQARLMILELEPLTVPIYIARDLFDRSRLRDAIWSGRRPAELSWTEENENE